MSYQIVQADIVIDAPAEFVWEALNDISLFVDGIDWVYAAWWEDEGPVQLGSVYIERAKPGPKEGLYRWEITAFEPPYRTVHSHKGSELEADIEVVCEPLDDTRTLYKQTMRFRAMPVFRPLGFVLERTVMKKKMQQDTEEMILPNYKRLIEQRYQAGETAGVSATPVSVADA